MSGWVVEQRRVVKLDELLKFETFRTWYHSRKESGRPNAANRFNAYLLWRAKNGYSVNPDEWIKECLEGNNLTLISHLKILKTWVESDALNGCHFVTRVKYYGNIRGFYLHHLVPLPKSKLSRVDENSVSVPVIITASQFLEMASRVLTFGEIGKRDRSVIFSMLQSGMDASTLTKMFSYVGFPQLVKHFGSDDWMKWKLSEETLPVKIDLIRPKTNYFYYTFLDRDAVTCLQDWLSERSKRYSEMIIYPSKDPSRLDTSDPIYVNHWGEPMRSHQVTNIFHKAGIAAGVNVVPDEKMPDHKGSMRRYPFHSHEVRDTIVTLGRKAGIDGTVVNFFVGHDIDKLKYDKSPWDDPEYFRDEYRKIASKLNIISRDPKVEVAKRKAESKIRIADEELDSLRSDVLDIMKQVQRLEEKLPKDE